MEKKTIVINGGMGFIGHHLARWYKNNGWFVRTVDVKDYEYGPVDFSDDYIIRDLTEDKSYEDLYLFDGEPVALVVNLAALMGGMLTIFTGKYDAKIMHDSALINIHTAQACVNQGVKKLFFSSSACVYNYQTQLDKDNPDCREETAWPSFPDSSYGKEKIFAEEMYDAYRRNHDIDIKIARFHNIFGPEGTWFGGKEKAPSAIARKVAMANDGDNIEIYGDGQQTRSFLYIDEAVEGINRLINSEFSGPVNLGSTELISINDLAKMVIDISGKKLGIKNIPNDCTGVRGRNSHNKLIQEKLGWSPSQPLKKGMELIYDWVNNQVQKQKQELNGLI